MESQSTTPVMDVSAPPNPTKPVEPTLATAPPASKSEEAKPESKNKPKATVQAKVKDPSSANGISMAIFATVVIVLGLSVIAAYAYIKTK